MGESRLLFLGSPKKCLRSWLFSTVSLVVGDTEVMSPILGHPVGYSSSYQQSMPILELWVLKWDPCSHLRNLSLNLPLLFLWHQCLSLQGHWHRSSFTISHLQILCGFHNFTRYHSLSLPPFQRKENPQELFRLVGVVSLLIPTWACVK